jgi:tripartite-type tricarboxylate transporter receptor subunit TctC
VPTVAEAALPGYQASAWYGILAPKGTPAAVRVKLEAAIAGSLTTPDVEKRLQEEGAVPSRMGGEAFGSFMGTERTRWAKLVSNAGITVD